MASAHRRFAALAPLTGALLLVASGCNQDPADDDDDTTTDAPTCEDGYVHDPELPEAFLEEFPDGCVPEECGMGRWGDLEVDGDTVYVDAWAADGGDGSEASPFNVIQDGLDAAGEAGGGMVAVAAGTYVENLYLTDEHDGVHLAGRCRELVEVDGSQGEGESGIEAVGLWGSSSWTARGLSVTAAPRAGIWLDGGRLFVTSTTLVANVGVGVVVGGTASELFMDAVEVLDTHPLPGGSHGYGIEVSQGGLLDASSCVVRGNVDVGIIASGIGTELSLRGVEVSNTHPAADGSGGVGVAVVERAHLEAVSCVVERNTKNGIYVSHAQTAVHLDGVAVRDTLPSPDGTGGEGIEIRDGAHLEASSCMVEGNTSIGVFVGSEGTSVALQGVEVRGTLPMPNGTGGRGIEVDWGARLEASSCVVEANADCGILAGSEGTTVSLQYVAIRDTLPVADGTRGRGIEVQEGAHLGASSCVVEGNSDIGIYASGEDTEVVLQGVAVRGTLPLQDGSQGRGIVVTDGAHLEASACSVEGNTDVGLLVYGEDAFVAIQDVEVRDTLSRPDV